MSDPLQSAYLALQREYLASIPMRLDELRTDVAGFRAGQPDAVESLRVRLHRLAGSAGSYGFQELSAIAREAERWLANLPEPGDADQLETLVDRMAKAAGKGV